MTNTTWFQVARRPKWLAALVLAMLLAAGFAALGQWQLERTFVSVGVEEAELAAVPIEQLVVIGEPAQTTILDRLVTFEAKIDYSRLDIVTNRVQLVGEELVSGHWLIANSSTQLNGEEYSLILALGFSENLQDVYEAKRDLESTTDTIELTGYLEPTEAPLARSSEVYESLSLSQLVNDLFDEPTPILPIFVIVTEGYSVSDLEMVQIDIQSERVEINWLTAFYAVEWLIFGVFAFYLWWRLVRDEQEKELEASLEDLE